MDPKKRRAAEPDDHIGFLDEVEGARPRKKAPKHPDADDDGSLDLDKIW